MTLDQKLETAVLITLWIELGYDHWWNSRENRIKRRKKLEKGKGLDTTSLSRSSGQKDVALESGQKLSIKTSEVFNAPVEMREMREVSNEDRLRDKEGPETSKD